MSHRLAARTPTSTMLALACAILVMPTCASAQTSKAQAGGRTPVPKIDCAAASATPELNHCAEIRLKKAEIDLAGAVRAAEASIAKASVKDETRAQWKEGLVAAQKAFVAWREADCKGLVPYEWQGGTGTSLAVLECMAQMTEQRAFELTERYVNRK